jgi:hypothetical protein
MVHIRFRVHLPRKPTFFIAHLPGLSVGQLREETQKAHEHHLENHPFHKNPF